MCFKLSDVNKALGRSMHPFTFRRKLQDGCAFLDFITLDFHCLLVLSINILCRRLILRISMNKYFFVISTKNRYVCQTIFSLCYLPFQIFKKLENCCMSSLCLTNRAMALNVHPVLFLSWRGMEPRRPWWLHGLHTLFCARKIVF